MGSLGPEPGLHLRREVVHGEQPRARGGDLDRERKAVQADAQLADHLPVGLVELEAAVRRTGALDEQLDGRVLVEGVDGDDALVGEAKRRAAGAQQEESHAALDQVGDERRRARHVLEVVEHEEQLPVAEVVEHGRLELAGVLDPERARDLGEDEVGVVDRREPDKVDAVGELPHERTGRLDRETRLARPTGPDEGDESSAGAKQVAELRERLLAPDRRAAQHRQVRRGGRP